MHLRHGRVERLGPVAIGARVLRVFLNLGLLGFQRDKNLVELGAGFDEVGFFDTGDWSGKCSAMEGGNGGKHGDFVFDCFKEHRWLWEGTTLDPVMRGAFIFREKA